MGSIGPTTSLRSGSHIAALDGLRGLAILAVVLHHYVQNISYGRVDRFVIFWTYGGWVGVDLFFVLSGFLITGILFDSKHRQGYFRNFFVRRALRIWPLYFAVLFVSLIVVPYVGSVFHWEITPSAIPHAMYWLYMTNVGIALNRDWGDASLGHLEITWSLAIEEQFYLTWPFAVYLLGRRQLIAVCIGLIIAAFALRVTMLVTEAPRVATYVLTFTRMDALATGSLIALMVRGFGSREWERCYRWACRLAVGLAIAVVMLGSHLGGFRQTNDLMQSVGYSLIAFWFGSLLVVSLGTPRRNWFVQLLELSWLRTLGRFSYALYLAHIPVKMAIEPWYYRPEPIMRAGNSPLPTQIMFTVTGLALSLLVSWVSWHLLEKHFLRLKRYFGSASEPAPVVGAVVPIAAAETGQLASGRVAR